MELEVYYQLKHEPEQMPETVRLRHREWTVLLSFDGNQSVEQILKRFAMERAELKQMLEKFRREDLIEDAEITYADFMKRQENARKEEQGRASSDKSGAIAPIQSLAPLTGSRTVPLFTPLPVPISGGAAVANVPPTPISMSEAPRTGARKLSLKAVMDYIIKQAGGDPNAGQLAVYRVFMRVDTKLLRRNGINSLRFQDDRLVSDPDLENALAESIESALGSGIPESVFVAG